MKKISSLANPILKNIIKIASGRQASSEQFIAEGEKLIKEGIDSDAELQMILQAEGALKFPDFADKTIMLSSGLMKKISGMVSPSSSLGIFKIPDHKNLQSLLKHSKMLIILDRIQDPGNLGTILRTSVAMGADAVLLLTGCCNPFNQKVVRSSMGAIFHIPVFYNLNARNSINMIKSENIACISTSMDGNSIFELQFPERCALFLGHEGQGLEKEIKKECPLTLAIPMQGKVESLNVAASAAICLYEWARQTDLKFNQKLKRRADV